MNPNETRYANAIRAFIESDLDVYETAAVYNHLRHDFKLSDEEISDLGFDFLIPAPEPKETKIYRFRYVCKLEAYIGVEAHDEEEAETLMEDELAHMSYDDFSEFDGEYELVEIE